MKLVDLNPRWFTTGDSPDIVGVTFDCPHCRHERLGVLFVEEIDRDGLPNSTHWAVNKKKWNRQGETFETLTLSPSIDASESGHWHGFIRNGEIA